ncbi:MAG: SH3 domain-containing protein [Chloroflexota bacterium]|nr:SH3 domain-containing protein [Chloroflexota bacterium]
MRRNAILLTAIAALILVLMQACALGDLVANEPAPIPTPSRTPHPTFTPTPPETPTPIVAPTNTPSPVPLPTNTPAEAPPTEAPAEPPAAAQPTDTPAPETAQVIIDNPTLNVRQGPGTNYRIIGRANNGERYDIKGKNSSGSWWQINFNGQDGWVSGSYVRTEGDTGGVQVASNIPAPPPPPTAIPRPTQPPAPTAPPKPKFPYSYETGSMISNPNCGSVYMEGKVVDGGGNGINGIAVMLEFFGNRVYRITGVGKNPGEFGFTPLSREMYESPVPFNVTVVQGDGNPAPLSDSAFIDFRNCNAAGQFTNIRFRKN